MTTNKIDTGIVLHYELSTKQWVGVGVVVLVALTAIALGTMALLNLKANMTFFHALGGMKEAGAWALIGTGAGAIVSVLSYLSYKYIIPKLSEQILCENGLDPLEINKKFEALAAERVGKHIQNGLKKGRYSVWIPIQSAAATQTVYILQIDPDKTQRLIRFMVPIIEENDTKDGECPSRGPLDDHRGMLTDKNYMFMPSFEYFIPTNSGSS